MLNYLEFYRLYGVRQMGRLKNPPLALLQLLELPRNSMLHYVGNGPLDVGPVSDEYVFRSINRPIYVYHVTELTEKKGAPIPIRLQVNEELRKYHNAHRRYRWARDLTQSLRDVQSPVVINYALLHRSYRYMRSLYAEHNRWWNVNATTWKQMGEFAQSTDRNQFLIVSLPKQLPTLTELRVAEKATSVSLESLQYDQVALESFVEDIRAIKPSLLLKADQVSLEAMTQNVLKVFNTPEMFFILELWKWLGENRSSSLLSLYGKERLDRLNLVFQESGRWTVLNIKELDSWREPTRAEKEANPELSDRRGLKPNQIQMQMVYFLMTVLKLRSVAGQEPLPESIVPPQEVVKQDAVLPVQVDNAAVTPTPAQAQAGSNLVLNPDTPTATDALPEEITDAEFAELEKELGELEVMKLNAIEEQDKLPKIFEAATPETGVQEICDKLAEDGLITAAEYKRYQNLSQTYKTIQAPDGTTLDKFVKIDPEILKIEDSPSIPDIPTVTDKSMLKSSLLTFDSTYIEKVLQKDIAGMVLGAQNAGICLTGYEVERVEDVMGSFDSYSVSLTPVEGVKTTFRFRLPVVAEDGSYTSNGVKYSLRKQRGDLPIRKVAPDRVALTSYYGKAFVNRSDKKVNDYGRWLCDNIMAQGLDSENTTVTNLQPIKVFSNHNQVPRLYSILSTSFRGFTLGGYDWNFEYKKREDLYSKPIVEQYEKDGMVIIGTNPAGEYLIVDKQNALYKATGNELLEERSIEDMLNLDVSSAPVDTAALKIMGKSIPMGIVLGYLFGLEKLMEMLRVTPRRAAAGTRLNLEAHEYKVVFSDETLIFSRDDTLASLIFSGFNEYHRAIRSYSVFEFDRRDVYLNIIDTAGLGVRYLREIDLMNQMFIDHITRDLLIEMKEPTNFTGLLLRASELLMMDYHPDEMDGRYMRIKGYERFAGAVYTELVRGIRAHNGRPGKGSVPLDFKPHAVWKAINQDPAVMLVQDINPIEALKDIEAVTYSGTGGRGGRSMTERTRAYNRYDMGTISEATKDSSDVGINIYTSADPQFSSLRGMSGRAPSEIKDLDPAMILSTSALISPGADLDDPKRTGFVSIQHGHVVACQGYRQGIVRTGYEQIVAHRVGDMFAFSAKKPGRVIAVSPEGMTIQYEDGTTRGIPLGRHYGNAAGLTIPHSIVPNAKEGDVFKAGAILSYNNGFFEPDSLNPSNVVWKVGAIVKTAILESIQTLEDSSSISRRVSDLMTTNITKVRTIVLRFDQSVRQLVRVGAKLGSEDILCIIEDQITANSGLFDEVSLDTLRTLSAMTPQAKMSGTVERLEVYYHGDKEDMSESLRTIANASDRELIRRNKAIGKPAFTGSVDSGFRVDGDPLELDTLAIKIFITTPAGAGVGDKLVFSNQMKTVIGEVMDQPVFSESGIEVDAIFGAKSIFDRIVNSPIAMGLTSTLLRIGGKKMVDIYRGR